MKFQIEPTKTYASEANVDKAVAKLGFQDLRHFVAQKDGRFFPVFTLNQGTGLNAIQLGVHWHFNVIG